jgi:hypothetical protein
MGIYLKIEAWKLTSTSCRVPKTEYFRYLNMSQPIICNKEFEISMKTLFANF